MFTLLEEKKDIAAAHGNLIRSIERNLKRRATKNIGYPGGTTFDAEVCTDGNHWFWSSDSKNEIPNSRKLNWYGVFNERGALQITVEINTPCTGSNGRIAGFFARRTEDGRVYLLHSGRVGGGTKGVGKSAFLAWSNHKLVPVIDHTGKSRDGVIVMPVTGSGSVRSAIKYVDTIVAFKEAVRAGGLGTLEFQEKLRKYQEFYSEFAGRRTGKRKSKIDFYSRHGDVVDALCRWRLEKGLSKNSRIVKNVQIDLGVETNGVLAEVYEVKTNCNRTDAYTAIGQLMVHSGSQRCQKFIVLPAPLDLPADVTSALGRLSVDVLEFELSESEAWIT